MTSRSPVGYTGDAIQAAIDSLPNTGGVVKLPAGVYQISNPLRLKDNVTLQGDGFGTVLQAASVSGLSGAIIQSTNPDGRHYGLFIRDISIDNRTTARGIGIDFTQVSVGGIENVSVANVQKGVLIKGAAFYNSFVNILVSNADIGMDFSPITSGPNASGANENRVFGARMVEVDVGFDIEADNVHFFQCGIEGSTTRPFTRGYRLRPNTPERAYTSGIGIYGARFENANPPDNAYNIEIGAGVTQTTIVAPYFAGPQKIWVKDHGSIGTIMLFNGWVVLSSPNGSKWRLYVDDAGVVRTTQYFIE